MAGYEIFFKESVWKDLKKILSRILNSQSHKAKFFERPLSSVMDKSPLIIESDTPIQKVVEQVISRAASKIYDHIIVVEKGRLKGTVPVRNIIEKLGALQEQKAQ